MRRRSAEREQIRTADIRRGATLAEAHQRQVELKGNGRQAICLARPAIAVWAAQVTAL
ncbi:MAG: hypothetical protein IH968_18100 [Gemmatimonadetes bacterium]|nr:hypothetical protein [Gemmatimonadota bacterium]